MFTFYKIFNIDKETVKWTDLNGVLSLIKEEYECITTIDVYQCPNDMDVNDLLWDYTYSEGLMMGFENSDVISRLDELIRIDKIRKLLN